VKVSQIVRFEPPTTLKIIKIGELKWKK